MKLKLTTTQIIMLSFLSLIFVGTFLLTLPISSSSGKWMPFVDALFTSTTSVCVTGLVVVPTFSAWSYFGQAVILVLIQVGGLGIITIMAGILAFLGKKFRLKDSFLIQDAFNLNSLSGLISFIKKVLLGTLSIEFIGALLYMTVFIKDFGLKGIWYAVFNSVSAFCNAGLDIIADNSLISYATNPIINFTTSFLIITGGIGFIVWFDLVRIIKEKKRLKFLTLHSKIALSTTAFLILGGAFLYLIFEYNNPDTFAEFNIFEKIQASLFQSVTTRTAGFATLDQSKLTNPSAILTLILMFIGGSPAGTAGGIKTVTLTVIVITARASIKNRNDTSLFSRTVPLETVQKALSVVYMSAVTVVISSLLLSYFSESSLLDILFETVSATATVGLSRNLTPLLDTVGKIIIIFTMYFGRIGPISLAFAFKTRKENPPSVKNPTEKISVG